MLNIKNQAWHLPWKNKLVPHALIDITRQCNVSCRSCYNAQNWGDKPLEEIKEEIETLLSLRKLDSISIIGGEPTLHPDLFKIIKHLSAQGLHSELFTNGLLLNDNLATHLRQVGLDMAFLHIQTDQNRPDLDQNTPLQSLERLLDQKTEILTRHRIEVGLSYTAHKDKTDELLWMTDYCLKNPSVGYLLVTMDTDVKNMSAVTGDIFRGMQAVNLHLENNIPSSNLSIIEMAEKMAIKYNFIPFGYLGANSDRTSPRWLSFMVVCAYDEANLKDHVSLKASYLEKGYLLLELLRQGKYPFYGNGDEQKLKGQLFLNSFLGGRCIHNFKFLKKIRKSNYRVKAKKILLQAPAYINADGKVVHCSNCPDAVLKNGKMVPVCISDRVVT